ncbi:MAG: hypothetical protein COV67_02400 [Nitrospinae bacterium CG11_big_fil_rev_8_21_14_0_20_56_8]|nr:MAG: hypothetical protein COV67_02400 [Nitrospinae bacterium CG11_big_fil_rev_8_21_14_0_20_56_8]
MTRNLAPIKRGAWAKAVPARSFARARDDTRIEFRDYIRSVPLKFSGALEQPPAINLILFGALMGFDSGEMASFPPLLIGAPLRLPL